MNTVTLPQCPDTRVLKAAAPQVFIDGQRRRDLGVVRIELSDSGGVGQATIQLNWETPPFAPQIAEPSGLPPIGAAVTILPPPGQSGAEFRGRVRSHVLGHDESRHELLAEVEHELAGLLAETITGLRHKRDAGSVELPQTRIVFNQAGGFCSDLPVLIGSRLVRVFDAADDARLWSVAAAMDYLLATAVPAHVERQSPQELESLCGEVDLGVLDITGLSVADALARVGARGGLAMRAASEGLGLVFYRPGAGGRRLELSLAPQGSAACRSNVWKGKIAFTRRPARRGVLVLGGPKQYECTFELRPGWDLALQSTRWRDFVRSKSSDWNRLGDVYRKWVLNEHGAYGRLPYALPTYAFEAISATDFALRLPRRLLPCLSRTAGGRSVGVLVEFNCGDGVWRRWRGPLWVSREECSLCLGGDALGADYFAAACQGTVQLRVTATVEADARLRAFLPGDEGCAVQIVNASSQASWREVHPSSVLAGLDGLGDPDECDDQPLVDALAARHQEAASAGVEAQFHLPWIDTTCQVGDIVRRVDGRGIELASTDAAPSVTCVRHDFVEYSTSLTVRG